MVGIISEKKEHFYWAIEGNGRLLGLHVYERVSMEELVNGFPGKARIRSSGLN